MTTTISMTTTTTRNTANIDARGRGAVRTTRVAARATRPAAHDTHGSPRIQAPFSHRLEPPVAVRFIAALHGHELRTQ